MPISGYWNPMPTIGVPNTITIGTPIPTPDPQLRIANALERIAFALEAINARHSITVTPAVRKPMPKKRIRRR